MHYYIDGYNLMFRILRSGGDLQIQRQKIIHDLSLKIDLLELHVTLVFDAQYSPLPSSRSHLKDLEISFTDPGETADEWIVNRLKRELHPNKHTVVTSDQKLAWHARRKGAHTETVEEFIFWLNRRYRKRLKPAEKPLIKSLPKKVLSPPDPTAFTTAEEGFDYYLSQFEMRYEEIQQEKPPKKIKGKLRRAKKLVEKEDESTNYERWLKAFERELEEDISN